jgi:ABC-3C protein
VLGTGTVVFASGKDGGRDAAFSGTATKFPSVLSPLTGKFIVQAKHTGNPVASCSDKEFARVLQGEHKKIARLVADGELQHYMIFTNRKKPATKSLKNEKILHSLGLKTAHLIGVEQLRDWLTQHPQIWKNLGFDRFDAPLRIQTSDITDVIAAFHASIVDNKSAFRAADFTYVPKARKNKINKLSEAYFQELLNRSLPFFKPIEDFLSNPRNIDLKDKYEDTADEIRRKLLVAEPPFETFDAALTYIIDYVTEGNLALKNRRRFATIFLHYMYYTCDIGQHDRAVEAS